MKKETKNLPVDILAIFLCDNDSWTDYVFARWMCLL